MNEKELDELFKKGSNMFAPGPAELLKTAELLKAMYDSFTLAGFSNEAAVQIVSNFLVGLCFRTGNDLPNK